MSDEPLPDFDRLHDFADLRESGLLWLINRTCFHPRGFSLSLEYVNDKWWWRLKGDGRAVIQLPDDADEDQMLRRTREFFAYLMSKENDGSS